MKQIPFVIMICFFLTSFLGCEKADEALRTFDKAKTVKEDIDKKIREVKDKAQGIIPGFMGTEKKSDGQDKEGSEDEKEDD
jgi:hypothetical protein